MIRFLIVLLFFSTVNIAAAQTHLDTLLQERKGLYTEYAALKEKKSTFWGAQSKKDLRNIIENLKAIIRKDDEIVREVNHSHEEKHLQIKQESVLRQTDYTIKNRNYTDRIFDLNTQVASLNSQNKKLVDENESLKKKASNIRSDKRLLEKVLFVGFLIIAGLIIYIRRLNKKTKPKRS